MAIKNKMNKIAIIGISGLFPGSSTKEAFWNNLMNEKYLIEDATAFDLGNSPEHFYDPNKGISDKMYSTKGGFIRNFDWDAKGFQIAAEEILQMDKMYQWSLYVAREALKNSGYWQQEDQMKNCGLVLGNLSFPTATSHQMMSDFYNQSLSRSFQELLELPDFKIPNSQYVSKNTNRLDESPSKVIAQALGLEHAHYCIDAACASSLYAIKLASDDLRMGKSDLMLAGAVCASDQLFIHMGFSIFHAYADYQSSFAPLDKKSGGLISSEGAGMVVLKRLEDAEKDGDQILAVINGIPRRKYL